MHSIKNLKLILFNNNIDRKCNLLLDIPIHGLCLKNINRIYSTLSIIIVNIQLMTE